MWKAAFGGRSERGGSTFDDAASTSSRRRRHRRGSNDDKSVVSSASRRTDGDRKRLSRNDTGVSYGSAPIPRLTESAVNAFNANDDDDDIWEDEADLKSERRSKRSESRERRHRRKSSGRSERSRSRERESSSKHKKSSGRSERSRSRERERDGWVRKSNGRSERSRSRERDDKDRKRKDEKSSRVEQPNGKSRILAIMDEPDNISAMPSSIASYDQYPPTTNPSTVRFDEHTMSGALDPHVANQFPGQNPSTYTKPDFDPNPHGAAADYYNDRGQSVIHQPGERAYTPNPPGGVSGSSSVAAPSGSTKPTKASGKASKPTKQSSSSSSTSKPSRKSSRAVSPPASTVTTPMTAIGGAAAANHHMQARASTQYASTRYDQSELSQTDFVHDRPLPSTISGPSAPIRHNSEPLPPTVGAASSYYNTATPAPSGMYAPSQTNTNTGKYAAAAGGAAAAGMAGYGMSQHSKHNQQQQRTQYDQQTQYSEVNSQYGPPPSYGPQSQYSSQAPITPNRYGSQYGSTSGGMPMGMHHPHEHKGPISRLKDGFLNLLSSPEDVAKMEEYTEYIGVCKHCFDPRSSPYAGPRKHHYHPRKKDSFETLRRRSLERMQRRRSDESLRRTSSKVHKENRYFSSDRKSSSNSNANYLAGGLAAAGAATAGAAMFSDRKNFDDTYSVKSGHRATSAVRRRGSSSSFESRRRTSRGRVASDRHEEFITVRTKDGRIENRKVNRSRSGSTGRKSNWIAPAAIGVAGAAAASRHRRRSSPDQGSLHHDERRYRSRSSSRSHSPGLGEIFGFTEPKPRRSGRRSPFGSYQDSRKEQQRRKEKGGFFTFSNGSASSSESGMAFGDINGSNLSRRSSGRSAGKRKVPKKSSDEKLNKTLLGIGATAAALTAASKISKPSKQGPRPSLGPRRDVRVSQYGPAGHKTGPPGSSEDGEWVDELPSDVSSDESALAFDDGNARRKLSSRPSVDSLSSQSSNDGLSAWGWRWGSKKQKKQRPTTPPDHGQYPSASTLPIVGAGVAATGAAVDAYGRRVPSDVGLVDNTATPQAPMQYIDPQPLSEAGSRYSAMPGAFEFEDPPLQQPQPIAPFQPAFTQASPEDPLRPTAGPAAKPALRRSVSSPTQTKGSFMGDAAFIGGAAVATAGIIASQNRKSSPGVRFGFNGEQQEKFDREVREEKDREDRERRRADRTRALKEEAERFAKEEDEKRVLAEQKRREREEEDREHLRQLENEQREEAYRRDQAQLAEESRRRAEHDREAEERERQMSNDRQIREELERKQKEREEKPRKSKSKKKDKAQDEESQRSSWKGPVAAGMAGAVAGAVLDGALHKEGRERAQDTDRPREAYSTQTFEPTYEHSGAPITDDDLIDPDFFKRRHSAAELQQYDELSREKLDELTHEREDYYNMPSQSQKDFFMPKELLDKQSEGKERVADPYGDNDVDVYPATGGEARHVYGNDYGKYGKAPFVHQNVPKLHVTAPTPPHSTAGSTMGDRSAAHSPLTEVQNIESPALDDVVVVEEVTPDGRSNAEFYQRPFAQSVSDFTTVASPGTEGAPPVRGWVEGETNEEEARHVPGGFNDSVYEGHQQPSVTATAESAWEPPLSKKEKKKREKAGKRDSEPVTPLEEDVPAARSVAFDEPQETFEAPLSKKDKKKKGKAAKQASAFDEEPVVIEPERAPEPEPEPEQTIAADPVPIEEDFAPLIKKDKKKKGKKGAAFEDPEPAANEVSQIDVEPAQASSKVEESAWEPPLSKKEQKKRDKAAKTGLPVEGSEPSTPVNERSTDYVETEPESASQGVDIESKDTFEPPLSKKEKKKREKERLSKSLDDFEQTTPLEEPAEPVAETRAVEDEPAWEPPLSKKDKKKREKEAKQGASYDSTEPSTPVNEAAEPMSASRELDAEPAWEPPLSKKDKKKREKEAKNAFAFNEPSTPPNETTQQDADPLVQEVAADFEAPLSKKDKKKREKEAQRQSLDFDDPVPEPYESQDPLFEQTREMENEPLASNQETVAEPAWEPPLSKKDKKKRENEGKRQSVSFEEPELVAPAPEFAEAEQSREADAQPSWEPPLSKKEQKKREKEAKNQSFGDVAAAVMTTAGVAAIADAVNKPEDDDYGFDTGKKSKKKKKSKGQSFDDGPSDMPGGWDESSSDAAKDPYPASTNDREPPRDVERTPAQESPVDDLFGADTKKSKKKKKRESSRFSEPAIGSPLRSEIAFDDYVGEDARKNGASSDRARSVDANTYADAEATGYGRGGRGPSYYDDDYPSGGRRSSPRGSPHGSRRGESPDDAHSAFTAPTPERRRSSKSKSKRSSGVYEGEVDFDDTRSIRSSATEPAFSSKKEKKSGLFGLFSRSKSSDGDKRDQSFLGDRVEDLPPLPLDSQTSTISASAQEEQDRGNPAIAEAVDQAVIADASNKTTQSGEASGQALSPDSPAFAQRPGVATRPLSSTSVPLRFKPIPSSPSLPKERSRSFSSAVESVPISPSSVSASGSHKKPSRPRSSEFREVRPLYLVSRNSKLEDVEEQLPDLPESKPSSRASSVHGSEDWHSAAEDMSPQPDVDTSPRQRRALTIDLDQANRYRTEEEIMDTADQTTPKASDFPQTALHAPRSHPKQVPQFYTWEDLAKDEELHEAAARQAEGSADAMQSQQDTMEGLGIVQDAERSDSPAGKSKSSKKDKSKSKGLAAAAALAGGAAAGVLLADNKKDESDEPTADKAESGTAPPQEETGDSVQDPAVATSGSIYHVPVAGSGNTDIWGDPLGDAPAPEQADAGEDVWGDEEFADCPSLPREMTAAAAADQDLDPMAMPAEGATPARTGGPMTNMEEDFDDWFGSTDPTPKTPILLKGKKGKKAKKGKAAQAKPTSPAKPVVDAPAEEVASSPAAEVPGSDAVEAERAAKDTPPVDQEEDPHKVELTEQPAVSEQTVQPEDSKADLANTGETKSEEVAPETTQASDEASREITTESPAAVPEGDDFFAPANTKKQSKKAKKGKKNQAAAEEPVEAPVENPAAEPAPPNSEATEATVDDGPVPEVATSEDPSPPVNDPAGTDPSPPDDDWASMPTSKKGKKAKKGKKQKSDPWTEPEPETEPAKQSSEGDTAAATIDPAAEPSLAISKESQQKPENDTAMEASGDSKTVEDPAVADLVGEKNEPTLAATNEPTPSTEPVSTTDKEATQQPSSRGWFSWPWGAKKAADEGLEIDTATMQAREMPNAAEDPKPEVLDTEKQSDEFVTPEEKSPEADQLLQNTDASTSLPADNSVAPQEASDEQSGPTMDSVNKPELSDRELDAPPAIKQDEASLEPNTQPDLTAVEQQQDLPATNSTADDYNLQTPAEQNEVAEDLWGASSSKKKKGKKGKKSGQTTPPVVTEEPVVSTTTESSEAPNDKATQLPAPQTPPIEAREVPESAEPVSADGDTFWTPEPSKKKKGKKGKKSDQASEELPSDTPVDVTPGAVEAPLDSEQTQTVTEERAAPEAFGTPEAEKPEEADTFWTPQSTKKKGKKAKKTAATASTPWDELVEEDTPIDVTSGEVNESTPAEPKTESQNDAADASTAAVSETVDLAAMPAAEPAARDAPEPSVDDAWDALPSKKKGKKGKKAAKEVAFEPTTDDLLPPQGEAPSTEAVTEPQGAQLNEPTPEQAEVTIEQPSTDLVVDQETPAAEPEEFWAPQPKGKKGKKGKMARSDPAEESSQPMEPAVTLDDQVNSPVPDSTEAAEPTTESHDTTKEVPEETASADFWEPPAKGKKAKKGKKSKGGSETVEEPSEANQPTPESQKTGENADLPVVDAPDATEAGQETPLPVDVVAAPEQVVEPESAPIDDDWSALTTSKKSKKAKKGKKAALEPEPSDVAADQTAPESSAATTEPVLELPNDTQDPVTELPKDSGEASAPTIVEETANEDGNVQSEPSNVQDPSRDLPSDVTTQNQVQEGALPEQSTMQSDPVESNDIQEAQVAAETTETTEIEPTSTKKSKKDKKKNRKSQALETDDQALPEREAQDDPLADAPQSLEQDAPQPEVPANDESAATPAEEVDDWGSFASTKKSKKDKKKAKKGKIAENEDLVASPQPEDPLTDPSTALPEGPVLAPDSTSTPVVDPSSVRPDDQAPAADSIGAPVTEHIGEAADYYAGHPENPETATEQEGAAADYFAGHPENPESATRDPLPTDQAAEELTPATRDAQPAAEADPAEDFASFSTGKSKKDKKKAKKSAASSWDTPGGEGAVAGDEAPAVAIDAEPAIIEHAQPAETDPAEEFGASSSKKSKKDKKKSKKNAADPWDAPEAESTPAETETPTATDTVDPEPTSIDEVRPTEAEPADEFGAFSSKKSKKDKKKAKKTAADSWDVLDSPATSVPDAIDQSDANVVAAGADDVAPSSNQENPISDALDKDAADQDAQNPSVDPSVEARSLEADADIQGDVANVDEEFSVSTKKSKKDKKKAKKSKNAGFDEPSEDITAPSGGATSEETPIVNEPVAPEAPLQDATATAVEPSVDATPDASADAPLVVGEPSATSAPLESSTTVDDAVAREVTQSDVVQGDAEPENDEFGSFSSKKSKKDKKKAKKAGAALPSWDEPEMSTAPLKASPAIDEPGAIAEEGSKEASADNAPDTPAPQELTLENEPTPAPVEPEEDADAFGFASTKKSKKDKKKAKKSSTATPDGDESVAVERNVEQPMESSQQNDGQSNEATLQDEAVNATTDPAQPEPTVIPAEAVAEDDGEAFGSFSSKKNKKDKKKAKKAQEADVQVEDPTSETPAATDAAIEQEPASIPDPVNETNALGTEKASNDPIAEEPAVPGPVEGQADATADDIWAAPAKKSKKDKKKGKKAQEVESEAVPAEDEAKLAEPVVLPESADPAHQVPVNTEGQDDTVVSEPVDQNQEAEAEDLWATPAKKSKKDKKKAKKAQLDEADPEAVQADGDAKSAEQDPKSVLDPTPVAIDNTTDTDRVAVDATTTPATEQSPEDADAWGSISTKKSKKDKKKSKKTQFDEPDSEVQPVDDNSKPAEQEPEALLDSTPATAEALPDTDQVAISDERKTPATEQAPEDADAWGSLSAKKSKKDKKKSKKAKTGDEDLFGEDPATPASEQVNVEAPDETIAGAEVAATDVQEASEEPWPETSAKQTKKEKRKSKKNGQSADTSTGDTEPSAPEPLERALEAESIPIEQPTTDALPVTSDAPVSSDVPEATLDTTSDATRDMDTTKSDEPNSAINLSEPIASEQPDQDIDFAATLAAGLADSGFDPNLVVDDPAFHRRASPTNGTAEADPEEVFMTSGKKKKGKSKKPGAADMVAAEADHSASTEQTPNDFDAALSQGLQDSGFDPLLLMGAMSSGQEPTSAELNDEDEFAFTKSNKKKKKGKKGKETADVDDALPPVTESPEPSTALAGDQDTSVDPSGTQEERSLDADVSTIPVADATAMDATNDLNVKDAPGATIDANPEVPTQSTEAAGEDEWGAPSKKKKSKKGKKQQDVDWQDGDNTSAPAETSAAPNAEEAPDQVAVDEISTLVSQQPNQTAEDEWAAPSLKKKKGKKNKKNVDLDLPEENVEFSRDVDAPADASNDPGMSLEPPSETPFDVAQETAQPESVETQPAESQPMPTPATEEAPVASETIEENWAAPSKKKDKKNKKKKGVAWDEPEAAPEETSNVLVGDTSTPVEQVPDESDPMACDINGGDNSLPTEHAETTPATVEATQAADDEWASSSKKKKGKKGKKNQDLWAESETPVPDTEPSTPAAIDVDETSAVQPESQEVPGGAKEDSEASALPSESIAETAEEEWGLPNKKKGKKNKQKQNATAFEPETQPATEPAEMSNNLPVEGTLREAESVNDKGISEDLAATSPAPADAGQQDDWALPIKKKGKKGKKSQMLTEDQSEAPDLQTPATKTETTSESANPDFDGSTLPMERSLGAEPEPGLPSTPNATTTQPETKPETTTGEDEWGLLSKKKGKKNKKKGAPSDANLDPFVSTPIDSPAPTSATDTAEASAAEGADPAMPDSFQPGGEMDVDEMDKAYKAYKKNKRKQKKMQNSPGDEKQKPNSEQDLAEQTSTDRGLDVSQEAEPVRQPSPLANSEPSWSFATLDNGLPSGEPLRKLSRPTSNGSLTSRRSMEPLHVDTGSRPTSQGGEQQQQQQQQPEPQSSHERTLSRDTPLEPTSRNRASYLFQSPAPFPEPTSDNASSLRTPEQRGDASDYFHSGPSNEAFSPPTGPMSPKIPLDPIPEEFAAHKRSLGDATNITPMEPAGKMQRRTDTPKAIREQGLSLSTSRDNAASVVARSVSNPIYGLAAGDEDRSLKRVVSENRSPSAMSNRSNYSVNQHVTPEDRRTLSRASNRSVTPTLRRTHLSGDLRAASRTSNRRGDAGSAVGVGARTSPKTIPFEPPPTPPLNDEDDVGSGATRAAGMAETFVSCDAVHKTRVDTDDLSQQGYGGVQQSQVSPTRPPSMRKRQSMHVMDLESKLEQLTSENRALQEAQQSRGLDDGSFGASGQSLQQTLDARELELREKNNEIQQIQAMLEPMQQEINRLVQINGGLTEANRNLVDDTNGRYATLQNEHAHANQQWQNTTRELENMRQEHSRLSSGMRDAVAAQLSSALAEKDHEIRKLKQELEEASERIRALQVQIQSSKTSDFLNIRDEDYFDGACQKLCQHVQQWVLRFSKMSDNRICRLSSDLRDEKIEARLDNALLDGMDVDKLLGDRVRRRDVFMSVVMTMVWEYVFTRYLFGMDREQRQKLKALEKTLSEVGPPRAVAQWRATTLTLLSKRPAFSKQCSLDTEAVAHEIFGVLSALLTPPTGSEQQLLTSLTKVITVAVNLSVEMRTQRAEYIMLPPLQPEYDTNGDLVRKVHFNASLMNERSGLFTSNEALEAERAIVKIVLFPLVVKKGDEFGEGEEEIVVCPAQVLVHNDSGKSRKVVRVLSGAMEIDDPRRSSKQSLLSGAGSMQF